MMGSERKEKKALSTFINDRFLIHLDEIKLFIDGKALQQCSLVWSQGRQGHGRLPPRL
jgi:hypothetical protein